VTAGRIMIDGHDIRDVTQASLRAQIGIVTQETFLFGDSVHYNIAYGRGGASTEEVMNAARLAHAHDFIQACPEGYQTMVGERGVRLSGGQRQRIAIARAILADARLVVVDEATSQLDTASETTIRDAIVRLARDRAVLVVSHRLRLAAVADRVAVIEAGRVVETGPPDDLLARGGTYARLVATSVDDPEVAA
jgi:ABC-type multidrug transport system fused ATPase/permease subunit